jgi:AcrR family transcriptional regulator
MMVVQKPSSHLSQSGPETDAKPTKLRLIDALLSLWADAPTDMLSVRTLVLHADAAQSAIHYHFGSVERLYEEASAAALVQAEAWMEARLNDLSGLAGKPIPPALQASLVVSTIADWTTSHRRLAMAGRQAPGANWQTAWVGFWTRLANTIGLGEHVACIASFAAGESARHLLVWNPVLDRALLEETAAALVLWLRERRFNPDPVRTVYRRMSLESYNRPTPRGAAYSTTIEQAAADLLAEHGHAGLTFRAVAAHAGVTLGKVVHSCGTKSELLRSALHTLYERDARSGHPQGLEALTLPPEVMLGRLLDAVLSGRQPVLRAFDEIERAIYNGDEHAGLRGVIRSMEDPSGTWALTQLLGGTRPPAALVAAFSAVVRGIGFMVADSGLAGSTKREVAHEALSSFR